ncbi:MAG: adenosylcobinamide-phosphate synthase CbiB [Sedimentibacter sp.]|uniref:adenosylcobinamide-phosphate synthase CbiB n=1 Tax=Sedimentibacter sp. TaxID=1960295 RepID=UPI00315861C1
MIPLIAGYIIDFLIGDPQGFPHPVRLIGKLISFMEKALRKKCSLAEDERKAGMVLWFTVVGTSYLVPLIILLVAAKVNTFIALAVHSIMCYYILAARSLRDESMLVYNNLHAGDMEKARKSLSYIVGRDVEHLNNVQIAKAAVETVAENTSDGVIAPMLYILVGGAPLGFMYKAINTLDSMVGYKNDKYINFGRFSAKADDAANFLPARIASYLMITAAYVLKMDYASAYRIYRRDRYNHKSPNSAHTESVCAGALNIMLGGPSCYNGVLVEKPVIGDNKREVKNDDIIKANNLMYATSLLCLILGVALRFVVMSIS